MEKSYNQRWKESGTTLSYKEWRKREDDKMASFNGVTPIQESDYYKKTQEEIAKKSGFKSDISGKTTFGIKNTYLILGGLILVGSVGYVIYKKYKK